MLTCIYTCIWYSIVPQCLSIDAVIKLKINWLPIHMKFVVESVNWEVRDQCVNIKNSNDDKPAIIVIKVRLKNVNMYLYMHMVQYRTTMFIYICSYQIEN